MSRRHFDARANPRPVVTAKLSNEPTDVLSNRLELPEATSNVSETVAEQKEERVIENWTLNPKQQLHRRINFS